MATGRNAVRLFGLLLLVWFSAGAVESGDAYEDDNSFATASLLSASPIASELVEISQDRSIHVVGDKDYVQFTLSLPGAVAIETYNNGALLALPIDQNESIAANAEVFSEDTVLSVYDADMNLLAIDDDSGPGEFSELFLENLAAGTYTVVVEEFGNDARISEYVLRFAARGIGPGTITFEDESRSSSEGDSGTRSIYLFVDRTNTSGEVSVAYATADGTAEAGVDYHATTGVLTWADGEEDSKSIIVEIIGDEITEPIEDFTVTLSDPTGGATLGRDSITVYIRSDEIPEDAYEDDDSFATASTIVAGEVQDRSIHDGSDEDFVQFTLLEHSQVIIETAGLPNVSGDTEIFLYDSSFNLVDSDDDSGDRTFSRLERDLQSGTYFVEVERWNNRSVIEYYSLSLTTSPSGPGELSFSSEEFKVAEGDVGSTVHAIYVERTNGISGAVSVSYSTTDGTAIESEDYDATADTLSWADGEGGQKSFLLTVHGDTDGEPDETVFLTLSNPTGGASLGDGSATLIIESNEVAPDAYEADDSFATAGMITVGEVQNRSIHLPSDRDFVEFVVPATSEVVIDVINPSTEVYLYDESQSLVTSRAGFGLVNRIRQVLVPGSYFIVVEENGMNEAILAYSLEISMTPSTPGRIYISAPFVTEGDDGTTQRDVYVGRYDGVAGVVTVAYATSDGTATAGSDYVAASGILTWEDGEEDEKTIPIIVNGDEVPEQDETFNLVLSEVTGGALLETTTREVRILDDDIAPDIYENDDSFATAGTIAPGEIQSRSIHDLSDRDYVQFTLPSASDVVIEAADDFERVALNLYDDNELLLGRDEASFSSSAEIQYLLPAGTYSIMVEDRSNSRKIDNYTLSLSVKSSSMPGSFSFVNASPSLGVLEGNSGTSEVTVSVRRDNGFTGAVSVAYAMADGSASAGSDYVSSSGTLTWADGDGDDKTFTLTINGDTDIESDEVVFLYLLNPTNGAIIDHGAIAFSILDDEFEVSPFDVYEPDDGFDDASVIELEESQVRSIHQSGNRDYVQFTLTEATDVTIETHLEDGDTVMYLYDSSRNLIERDDDGGPGLASFISRELVAGIYYIAVEDFFNDGTIDFYALSLNSEDPTNSNAGFLSFSSENYWFEEGGSGSRNRVVTVKRLGSTIGDIEVDYSFVGGSAESGVDYTGTDGSLSWLDGESSDKSIVISVNGDTSSEPNETIHLSLSNATNGAVIATENSRVIIENDDVPPDVYEDDNSFASASAILNGEIQLRSLHAIDDVDYVEFAITQTSEVIVEADVIGEDVILALYDSNQVLIAEDNFGSNRRVERTLTPGTYWIRVDEDGNDAIVLNYILRLNAMVSGPGMLSFSETEFSENESSWGNRQFSIDVDRTGGAAGAVSVAYTTVDGTAAAGSDYSATNGVLNWADGDSSTQQILVTFSDDTENEQDETFYLRLSSITGGASLGDDEVALTIRDNESPTPELIGPATAGASTFTTTVTFDEPITGFALNDIKFYPATVGLDDLVIVDSQTLQFEVSFNGAESVTLAIREYAVQDAQFNASLASSPLTVLADTLAPTADIDGKTFTADNPIAYTVSFSEDVVDFNADDLVVTNGSVTNFSGSGTDYSFAVTRDGPGMITIDLPAGAVQDLAGNDNEAAERFFTAAYPRASTDDRLQLHRVVSGDMSGFSFATQMAFGPDGRLYVARNGQPMHAFAYNGSATLGSGEEVIYNGSSLSFNPFGIAFHGNDLYATAGQFTGAGTLYKIAGAVTGGVWAPVSAPIKLVDNIPVQAGGAHAANQLLIQGDSLYLPIGNTSDTGAPNADGNDGAYSGSVAWIEDLNAVVADGGLYAALPASRADFRAKAYDISSPDALDPFAPGHLPFTYASENPVAARGKLVVYANGLRNPFGITAGLDGKVWVTNNQGRENNHEHYVNTSGTRNIGTAVEQLDDDFSNDRHDQLFELELHADYGYRLHAWRDLAAAATAGTPLGDSPFFHPDNRRRSFTFDNDFQWREHGDFVWNGPDEGLSVPATGPAYDPDNPNRNGLPGGLGPHASANGLAAVPLGPMPDDLEGQLVISRWTGLLTETNRDEALAYGDVVAVHPTTGEVTRLATSMSGAIDVIAAPDGSLLIASFWNNIYRLAARTSLPVTLASTADEVVNDAFTVTITFDQPVSDFTIDDVVVSNGSKGSFTGSGMDYSLVVNPTSDGVVSVTVAADVATDAAGFSNLAASLTREFDGTAPAVMLTSTGTDPIALSLVFSEPIDDFNLSDLSLSNAVASNLNGSGTAFTATVEQVDFGAVTIQLPANVVVDAAGNGNTASNVLTYDLRSSQTITFASLVNRTYGDAPLPVTASSSSGLPITYRILSGPAALSGGLLSFSALGEVVVVAEQAGNERYFAAAAVERRFSIQAKSLQVTGLSVADKTYDGLSDASFTGGTLTGVVPGDDVELVLGTASFADAAVATNKSVTLSGFSLSGSDKANYILEQPPEMQADIISSQVSLTGLLAEDKIYDGTVSATFSGGVLAGVLQGDDVTVTVGTASFADSSVGLDKEVSFSGFELAGSDAANYLLAEITPGVADIAVRTLTVNGLQGEDKIYDGTRVATASGGTLEGVLGSDAVTLQEGSAAFADKNVGSDKSIILDDYSLAGDDADNYVLQMPTVTGDITPAPLTLRADSLRSAFGSELPELTYSWEGFVGSETAAELDGQVAIDTEATAISPLGDYPIVVTYEATETLLNYAISSLNGVLEIVAVMIEPPTDTDARDNSVSEDAAIGVAAGVTATASHPHDRALTYSLDNDAGGLFIINAQTGVVTVAAALDYETARSHEIIVRASDGANDVTAPFTVSVSDNGHTAFRIVVTEGGEDGFPLYEIVRDTEVRDGSADDDFFSEQAGQQKFDSRVNPLVTPASDG